MYNNQNTRIIVKLDVKPPYVVKPVLFEGLRKIGLSSDLAKKYYSQGADEIMYIDIVASLYQREILYENIEKTASTLFVPFGVGGGVKSVDDFSKLFHIGADKVVINTYAIQEDPNIINEAAEVFGNQSVVVNIESKRYQDSWKCHTDGGKIESNIDVLEWAKEAEARGAGEILLQSIDHDGLEQGFDLELAKKVVDSVGIPVVIASGAGSLEDIKELIEFANPSGVAISTLLHDNKFTISEIKNYLKKSI
ncbi:MAG: imidazole glycerol phosphate synthase subunit HisF [Sulfurimonas sp.]|nr:imidazole glycerol phosphate synthase subunit HisF [Sulfurimonas sp.]